VMQDMIQQQPNCNTGLMCVILKDKRTA